MRRSVLRTACLLAFTGAAVSIALAADAPLAIAAVPVLPLKMSASAARDACASHPAHRSFAVGRRAVAYFRMCSRTRPGWSSTLWYLDAVARRTFVLQMPGSPPAMLGFDDDERLSWLTTREGESPDVTQRVSRYRLDDAKQVAALEGSVDLPAPAAIVSVSEGRECWITTTTTGSAQGPLVLVPKRGRMRLVPALEHERVLFWDSTGSRFVTVRGRGAGPYEWSSVDCEGVRAPVRASLRALLDGFHSPYSQYLSSPSSDLVLVSLLSDATANDGPRAVAFRTAQDRIVVVGTLMGDQVTAFHAFDAWDDLQFIAANGQVRMLRDGRSVRSIAVPEGWDDGLGFVRDTRQLALFVDKGVELIGMEN